MNLTLLNENDPKLREVSTSWDFTVDGDPTELVTAMTKVMIENNGIGLAAPQVGVMKRLFIMGNSDRLFVCINPEIVEGSGEYMEQEGCLSFPDLWLHVKRYESIKAKYYNVLGQEIIKDFPGLFGRIYQHERDHLDGICFDTRTAKLSLDLAKRRRKKSKSRRIS